MKRRPAHLLLAIALILPTATVASNHMPEPAPQADVASPKRYRIDGLRLELPGNWSVTQVGFDDETNNRYVRVDADLERPRQIALESRVEVAFVDQAATLSEWASAKYASQPDVALLGVPTYSAFGLSPSIQAYATRFRDDRFPVGHPNRDRLQLVAIRGCGRGWSCYASATTVEANREAAEAGIRLMLESMTYTL